PQTGSSEAYISWVSKKKFLLGCDCPEVTVEEEWCDVTISAWDFPIRSDADQRTWEVFHGVTLENSHGRGGSAFIGGYNLNLDEGTNRFVFSEPVDVDFGVTFHPIYPYSGDSIQLSPGLE